LSLNFAYFALHLRTNVTKSAFFYPKVAVEEVAGRPAALAKEVLQEADGKAAVAAEETIVGVNNLI